jgi:hypothetical protein
MRTTQAERDDLYRRESRLDGLHGRSADLDGHYAMLERVGYRWDSRRVETSSEQRSAEQRSASTPSPSPTLVERGYVGRATANGVTTYARDGRDRIRDEGGRIRVLDPESTRDAVRLARAKWGKEFKIGATDPERRLTIMKAMVAEGCVPAGMQHDRDLQREFRAAARDHYRETAQVDAACARIRGRVREIGD